MKAYCDHAVKCLLCQSTEHFIFQQAEDPYNILQCQQCRFVFVNPYPEENFLMSHYHEEDYYRDWIDFQMPQRIKMWDRRIQDLLKHRRDGKLLDIGCGIGTFLQLAKQKKFDVYGTEVSQYACKYIKEKYAINVFQGYLREAKYPDNHFDIVTLWHVLEHLQDPRDMLREIRRILKKGGMFVVAVPNIENYFMQMIYPLARGKKLKFFSIKDKELHLSHFSNETLAKFLKEEGFNPISKNLDMAQVGTSKRCLDYMAYAVHLLLKKNWSSALRIYAVKE